MLTHPTLDQLNQLGLFGMVKAFDEVAASGDAAALAPGFVTRPRDDLSARQKARLRYARPCHHAAVEDVDYRATRASGLVCNISIPVATISKLSSTMIAVVSDP